MGCLSTAQAAIDGAKATADSAKTDLDASMDSLKGLSPTSYNTRKAYENARQTLIDTTKGLQISYESAIDGINSAASTLSPELGDLIDAAADAQKAVQAATNAAIIQIQVVGDASYVPPVAGLAALTVAGDLEFEQVTKLQC